jgi:CubicO group peptidase (beta-lactamase class C family)
MVGSIPLASRVLCSTALLTLLLSEPAAAQTDLASRVDAIMAPFASDGPGASVAVVKDGRVLVRRAYGLANLETRTPMRPEMVFELGSVTKQFTSTAILMLAEQGKLALDDDIRKYVPDFPDKGAHISVEHLLTHTSGIKDYTNDPKWPALWRQDLTPAQVVDLVKDAPLEFAPGTKWRYDNTGYTLLGMILEKASGVPYAEFIRTNIFQPLGMTHSLYGSFSAIIPDRAAGYTKGESGAWENAPYLSMSQPYAAGSLMSNVDDLVKWDAAVSAGQLLSATAWAKAFTGYRLTTREDTRYGFGWQLGKYGDRDIVHHGGGIPGYSTHVLRMPADRVYVVVLANSDAPPRNPEDMAVRIAAEVIGAPAREPSAIAVPVEVLDTYAGRYQIAPDDVRTITREGTRMSSQRNGGQKSELIPIGAGEFAFKESFQRLSFEQDASGRVVRVVSRTLGGMPEAGERIR